MCKRVDALIRTWEGKNDGTWNEMNHKHEANKKKKKKNCEYKEL